MLKSSLTRFPFPDVTVDDGRPLRIENYKRPNPSITSFVHFSGRSLPSDASHIKEQAGVRSSEIGEESIPSIYGMNVCKAFGVKSLIMH
jgi:hypothetical protein